MIQPLLYALLHSLWQAVLMAVLLGLALRGMASRRTSLRYAMSVGALLAVVAATVVTWSVLAWRVGDGGRAARDTQTASEIARSGGAAPMTITRPTVAGSRSALLPRTGAQGLDLDRLLITAWGCGVGVMLARMVLSLRSWRKLSRHAVVPEEMLVERADALRRRMGIVRRVRCRLSDAVVSPCVVGIISPVLLIPAALVGNLPAGQMAMVLAHELAHIRRWDALVNVLQMLVEALLFFNPAVWWLSRQARIEREACCDAWAVQMLGTPVDYAQVLAQCAATLSTTVLAMGANEGHLLQRVKRVLFPQSRPEVRLPWYSLMAICVAGLGMLGLAGGGTLWAVEKILTPQERIEQVTAAEKQYAGEPYDASKPQEMIVVSGTIRTWDGKPVPRDISLSLVSKGKRSSSVVGFRSGPDGRFKCSVEAGRIGLAIVAPGYATQKVAAFEAADNKPLDILLEPEQPITVTFVDAAGEPVPDVRVQRLMMLDDGSGTWSPPVKSSQDGEITVPGGDLTAKLECTKSGFAHRDVELRAGSPAEQTVTLAPANPSLGRVVDTDGRPVSSAIIRLAGRGPTGFSLPYDSSPLEQLAVTDAAGRFVLDTLADDAPHTLWVEAKGFAPELRQGIVAGQHDLEIRMGPPRVIRGKVIGDLSTLESNGTKSPVVQYSLQFHVGDSSRGYGQRANVKPTPEGGEFVIDNLPPCEVEFRNGKLAKLDMTSLGAQGQTTIDLRPLEQQGAKTRKVTVQLVAPPGHPIPQGRLHLSWYRTGDGQWQEKDLDLDAKGEASLDVAVPSTIAFRAIDVPGYSLPMSQMPAIDDAAGTKLIPVNVAPAGTIIGRVLDPDGKPLERANISLEVLKRVRENEPIDVNNVRRETRGDGSGRFAVGPLPLGGEYLVVATSSQIGDSSLALGEPIVIDERNPIRQSELRFGKGRDVEVELVNEQGAPVEAPVALNHQLEGIEGASWGLGGAEYRTDSAGRFTFHNLTAPKYLRSELDVKPTSRTCGVIRRISPDDTKVRIALSAGLSVKGKLIDKPTGNPIGNRRITLYPTKPDSARYRGWFQAQTDADGNFVFGGLEPIVYTFNADDCDPVGVTYIPTPSGGIQMKYPAGWKPIQINGAAEEPLTIELQVRPKH